MILFSFAVTFYFILKFDFVKIFTAVEAINPSCFCFALLGKFLKLGLCKSPLDEIRIGKKKNLRNSSK
jgi:hypothetical protein